MVIEENRTDSLMRVVMLGMGLNTMGGIPTVERLIIEHAPPNTKVSHISMWEHGSAFYRVLVFGKALVLLASQLVNRQVDLVHIHFAERGSAWRTAIISALVLAFRQPLLLHAHACEFRPFYASLPEFAQKILSGIFSRCDRFIALSDSWKDFYVKSLRLPSNQVSVLLNPVELPPQLPSRSSEHVQLVFLGRIGHRKGAFDLIRAFSQLPEAVRQQARLVLAGDGEVEQARGLIHDLNLSATVTMLDWLNPQERDALLAESHVFVLPSHNEGLPMSLLEAMGWGLAAITTPVGGIPELVTHGRDALLVEPGDIGELAAAMQVLICDAALRQTFQTAARERVAPLAIEHYCQKLLAIYHSTLQAKLLKPSELQTARLQASVPPKQSAE